VQFDVTTGKKKVIAFVVLLSRENRFTPKGTYSTAGSPTAVWCLSPGTSPRHSRLDCTA